VSNTINMCEPMRLARADVLRRTPEGTRQLSARDDDLSPKLRAVLFLVNGRLAVGEILDRADGMKSILEGQIQTLIEMGLVEVAGTQANVDAKAEMPTVAGARIQLLKRLEASGSCEATLLAEELLDARTLRELAMRSREIAYRLRDVDSNAIAERFWNEAKAILVACRDAAANAGH
jgi:hypothetical protein